MTAPKTTLQLLPDERAFLARFTGWPVFAASAPVQLNHARLAELRAILYDSGAEMLMGRVEAAMEHLTHDRAVLGAPEMRARELAL